MLIDCDSCTARGTGCADCVVTVLLGAPPGWTGADPAGRDVNPATVAAGPRPGVVVELDEVERRAVRALADGGLVPPLRHQASAARRGGQEQGHRRTG